MLSLFLLGKWGVSLRKTGSQLPPHRSQWSTERLPTLQGRVQVGPVDAEPQTLNYGLRLFGGHLEQRIQTEDRLNEPQKGLQLMEGSIIVDGAADASKASNGLPPKLCSRYRQLSCNKLLSCRIKHRAVVHAENAKEKARQEVERTGRKGTAKPRGGK